MFTLLDPRPKSFENHENHSKHRQTSVKKIVFASGPLVQNRQKITKIHQPIVENLQKKMFTLIDPQSKIIKNAVTCFGRVIVAFVMVVVVVVVVAANLVAVVVLTL